MGVAVPCPINIKARDLVVSACKLGEIRDFVEANHYSHNINGVKVKYCFKVEHSGEVVGGVIFGAMSTTAWKKFADKETKVIELRRLVLIDAAGKNSESRVIGFCLRAIRGIDKEIEVVVSYADPHHGHDGTIYRASNFEYLGLSAKDKGFLDVETKRVYHSRALRTRYKGEYKPFVRRLRERLGRGLLVPVSLPQKHCFVFRFSGGRKYV